MHHSSNSLVQISLLAAVSCWTRQTEFEVVLLHGDTHRPGTTSPTGEERRELIVEYSKMAHSKSAPAVVLFAVRSPISVEYEETCHRLGIEIEHSVSLGLAPRVTNISRVIELSQFDADASCGRFYACAFVPNKRKEFFEQAMALGLEPADALVDPHAITARSVRIGDGSFLNSGAIIGAASFIGEGVLVNRASSIGHHALIADYVSIGPGCTLAGNVQVGSGTVIGAGATILPDVRIGENCLIGGGSLVRENVPNDTFVAGIPAKPRSFNPKKSALYIEDGE